MIDSSLFEKNTAASSINVNTLIKSSNGVNSRIYNSTFLGNVVKDGCIYYNGAKNQNTLSVLNCAFIENNAEYSQSAQTFSSGVYAAAGLVDIKYSLFLNNTDTGIYSSVVYASSEVHVSGSIFLLNHFENSNNVIINSKSSSNLKKIFCHNNWWGNTLDNLTIKPQIHTSSNCNSWLFLNASSNATTLTKGQKALINLELTHTYNSDGNITYFDISELEGIIFDIKATGGISGSDVLKLDDGMAGVVYTLTDYSGDIVLSYNGVDVVFNFTKTRIKPDLMIDVADVVVGQYPAVEIVLDEDITGNLTVKLNDIFQTKEIAGLKTTFKFEQLPAGEYVLNVIYSGDEHYENSSQEIKFNVNKYNSTTELSIGKIEIGRDVVLSVNVSDGATGNITLSINGKNETVAIVDSRVSYTINSERRL